MEEEPRMNKSLISFALLLATSSAALAGPSNLPTNIPQEDPTKRRAAPRPMALIGEQPRGELQHVTTGGGNGGQVSLLFRNVKL
jgi:hypothetical protein